MKLSVVILNYNVSYFLELCLRSVEAAITDLNAEIIVVDNNSQDDSCNMVKRQFPNVKLIENKVNFGFSKGNNIGVAQAQGEYICILNPDTVVSEDTFATLLNYADTKNNLGIVGCKLIDGTGKFLPESKRNIPKPIVSLKKMLGFPKAYYANQVPADSIGKVPIFVGAFMLMKKKVYESVGGLDEDYFMYGEDVDLSYKILKAGYENYYNGTTTIIHYKGESTLKNLDYAKRFYGAMQTFYQKHFKRNMLFNAAVWVGIKLAFLLRREPQMPKIKIKHHFLYPKESRHENTLKNHFNKTIKFIENVNDVPENSEIIFDANCMSYKSMISKMGVLSDKTSISFKILSKNATFILGSNSSKKQGEVIPLINK